MEFNGFPRDDGSEFNQDGADVSTPSDAERTALEPGVREVPAPSPDRRDHESLIEPPERTRTETVRGAPDTGALEMHATRDSTEAGPASDTAGDNTTEDVDEGRPTRRHVVETVPEQQQQFWTGLANASEQASRAAHVRNNAPNTDDAFEQDYHQHQLFEAVQAHNEAGAQSLFGVARTQVTAAQEARREAEATGAQEPELTDETSAQSTDGSVRIMGRALVDEEADILLSDGSRASFAIPEELQSEGSSIFSITTRQTVAQQMAEGADEAEPITLDVTNEFVVHGNEPGVAHWLGLTMDTVTGDMSDNEYFDHLTGQILYPMVRNGIPDEPEGTNPVMQDSFFRTLDAIGINSAVTQVGSTELATVETGVPEREQDLFDALDQAGYPVERGDVDAPADQQAANDKLTKAQLREVRALAVAFHYREYVSTDTDTVESMTNSLANFSQVAARSGDWGTVAICSESLNNMEQKVFTQFPATARVLLHQQELGLDIKAAEDLRTRLEAEKQQASVQPLLDTVIEECQALGISPEPWIETYAADNEDAFRRTMDHHALTGEPWMDDAVNAKLSTMATSLIEDTSFSPEFVCEMVPTAIASVGDRNLQLRLMDSYLEALEDTDMSTQEFSRLIEMGGHSITHLQSVYTHQATALETADNGALALTQHEALRGRQLVERYDQAISHAVLQLGSQGELTYESAMTQMYWAQELPQFGIEPSVGVPNFSIDGMIKDISEKMNNLPQRNGEGKEKPSRLTVINNRDSAFDRLAGVAIDNGAFGDARQIIGAMAPMNQAKAYVKYWARANTPAQLDSLDPALNVAPEMRPFEMEFNGNQSALQTHYAISRKLIEDDGTELHTRDLAKTDPERHESNQARHNRIMNRQGRAVGQALARLLPRAGEPAKPLPINIPLFRAQLDQFIDRLGTTDPAMQADLARHLLKDQGVRDAGDKELTFRLADVLARTGDIKDYATAREAIVSIRGGLKTAERQWYKLQLAEAYGEALAA